MFQITSVCYLAPNKTTRLWKTQTHERKSCEFANGDNNNGLWILRVSLSALPRPKDHKCHGRKDADKENNDEDLDGKCQKTNETDQGLEQRDNQRDDHQNTADDACSFYKAHDKTPSINNTKYLSSFHCATGRQNH